MGSCGQFCNEENDSTKGNKQENITSKNQKEEKGKKENENLLKQSREKDKEENKNLPSIPSQSREKSNKENNNLPIKQCRNMKEDKKEKAPYQNQIKSTPKNKSDYLSLQSNTKNKNEYIASSNQINIENIKQIDNLPAQNCIKNENHNDSANQNIHKDKNNNIFPQGTEYEKELNSNFKYFNVFWYNPNKTHEFDAFKKCFDNVQFSKGYNLYSTINFFKKESLSEWIVITPGSSGEELIMNLEKFECIKSFFVFCKNTEYHKWAKKNKKVGCLTSDPEILCQKLIEINKNYIIPKFNYNRKEDNVNILKSNELILNSSVLKLEFEEKKKLINKYNNICVKSLNYFNSNVIQNDFRDALADNGSILNMALNMFSGLESGVVPLAGDFMENLMKNLTLLSLYFNIYPYIFNLLSFQEVKNLFNEKMDMLLVMNEQMKLITYSEKLYKKIMENKSILDEIDELKEIQISLIKLIKCGFILQNANSTNYINYYQIINFFRDIDFCLKIYVPNLYLAFKNQKNNYYDEFIFALTFCESRYSFYILYSLYSNDKRDEFTEEENNIINETLTIKDFLIIGKKQFHEMIKPIEKNIKSNSFKYLNPEQLEEYLDERKKEKGLKIRPYFYFLIIRFEEFYEHCEKISKLSFKTGITFLAFLFVENEYYTKINKIQLNLFIPTILVYSPNDIVYYLSEKLNFINFANLPNIEEIGEFLNVKIPKISFEQNDEDKYQDGCFELAETFDVNLIRNKFILKYYTEIDYSTEFFKTIYNIYKEHNALDIFFNQNCLYFGWRKYPELISGNFCLAKRILYMYCREEKESQKSFYRIINDDLRSRDPSKIYQYINILALINEMIENEFLLTYEGKVFRATKLDEKLILKLIPGTKMVNTTFWSTSKEFQVAERFMKRNIWRNSYIICNAHKNNIDIDSEKLNPYNEKEVLFLPFTEFIVEKISSETKYGKKIFIIELTELENRNFVNADNMQVENVNNLGTKNLIEKFFKSEEGKKVVENFFNELKFN